jgi:hypothetical protein
MNIEKISAVTLRVANMNISVQSYRDVLDMELLYGGERAKQPESAILNLEQGQPAKGWGWLIHVADVDASWGRFRKLGFKPPLHSLRSELGMRLRRTYLRTLPPHHSGRVLFHGLPKNHYYSLESGGTACGSG